jgi:hypothetical protein
MDKAAAEREALRLWRNLPLQERLTREQAIAFSVMIAPTLEFDVLDRRTRTIEGWLVRDILQTETAALLKEQQERTGEPPLPVPGWPQREGAAAIAFVISLLVMIARRPDIVSNARFWAEDGATYFADAYNDGRWATLLRPFGGYLQLFPRAVFDLATFFPVGTVPALAVWIALAVRAALPAFLFSSRFSWIDWRAKVALSAYFLLMPNLADVHANITNTHWYIGLYLLAVIIADPPRVLPWKVHDWLVLLGCGLTGPMIILLVPALIMRLVAQQRGPAARWAFTGVGIGLAVLQLVLLAINGMGGHELVYLPNALGFLQMLGARTFLGFLTPARWSTALAILPIALPTVAVGLIVTVAVIVSGNWRTRSVAIMPVLIALVSFYTPVFAGLTSQWLSLPGAAQSGYFVVASVAWAATLLIFVTTTLPRLSNVVLAVVALVAGFLILFDFTLPAVDGPEFGPEVARLAAAAPGETVRIPIAPRGWDMTLVKR